MACSSTVALFFPLLLYISSLTAHAFKIISNKFLVKVVGVFDCFIRPAALISFSITWLLKEQPLLFVQYNKMTDCIKNDAVKLQ